MATTVTCSCGERIQVPEPRASQNVRCPACLAVVPVAGGGPSRKRLHGPDGGHSRYLSIGVALLALAAGVSVIALLIHRGQPTTPVAANGNKDTATDQSAT